MRYDSCILASLQKKFIERGIKLDRMKVYLRYASSVVHKTFLEIRYGIILHQPLILVFGNELCE